MTKDFKEEARTETSQYGISWMLGGVAVGLLAGIVMFKMMGGNPASNAAPPADQVAATNPNTNPATNTEGTKLASNTTTPESRPGFSYHAVLPVINMDESLAPLAAAPQENPEPAAKTTATTTETKPVKPEKDKTAKPETKPVAEKPAKTTTAAAQEEETSSASNTFMFQLGAYRAQAPALEMQAKARKYGMNTRVEQANVNGQVWYRIRIGPTRDPGVANRWRQSISSMGIDPIMIRM